MVLSFEQEKELLNLKEQQRLAERKFQLDVMEREHVFKMERLARLQNLVEKGYTGGKPD